MLERFWFPKSLESLLRLSLVYCNTKDKPLQTSAFPIKVTNRDQGPIDIRPYFIYFIFRLPNQQRGTLAFEGCVATAEKAFVEPFSRHPFEDHARSRPARMASGRAAAFDSTCMPKMQSPKSDRRRAPGPDVATLRQDIQVMRPFAGMLASTPLSHSLHL